MATLMKYADDAYSTLSGTIHAADTVIGVVSVDKFPELGAGEWFPVTMERLSDGQKETVKVTAVTADPPSLTVDRDAFDDEPQSFYAGDKISIRMNKAILDEIFSYIDAGDA